MTRTRYLAFLLLVLSAASAAAQAAGPISLDVDLRDAGRQLFHSHEVIPVQAGTLILYYPKWIPGEHSPSGPLENVAGLKITADQYPYEAGSIMLAALLPTWVHAGGVEQLRSRLRDPMLLYRAWDEMKL